MKTAKLLSIIIIALTAKQAATQCTDGCLMCDKIDTNSSKCQICDSFASYVPFGDGLCFKLEVEGCLIPTTDRSVTKCIACKEGSIYDTTTHKCKEVAKPIENCQVYDNTAACSRCAKDYYLKEAKCVKVETPIENCGIYSSDGVTCVSCANDYYKSPFDGKCVKIETSENCLAYSNWDCTQCGQLYVRNSNLKLNETLNTSQLQTFVSAYITQSSELGLSLANTPIDNCQKGILRNCFEHETFDTCKICNTGFLLSEDKKTCHRLPEPPITNCKVYTNATTCQTCVNGTYKDNSGACVASTIVANCFVYSQSSDACDLCEYGFYKQASECKARVNSLNVSQCKTLNQVKDECQECNPNFVLNPANNTQCLTGVVNCKTYDISGNSATCSKCDDGYGLDDKMCVGLSTQFCHKYKDFTNVCQECLTDYYLDDETKMCFENTSMNCETKHKELNECVTCDDGFWSDNGDCKIQNIANCFEYEDNVDECKTCASGHYLDPTTKKCFRNTSKNCKEPSLSSNSCVKCHDGYYPDSNTVDKCAAQNQTGCEDYVQNQNVCSKCRDDHYPEPTPDVKCSPQANSIADCNEYETGLKECKDCNLGTFIDTNNSKICSPFTDSNCKTQIKDQNQCQECKNLYYLNSGVCTATGISGCKDTDGTSTSSQCVNCEKEKVRTDATTCDDRTGNVIFDPLCIANANEKQDNSCSVCPDGKTSFFTDLHDASSYLTGCQKFDTSSSACLQCAPGYFTNTPGDICGVNVKSAGSLGNCLYKTENGVIENSSTAGNCAECVHFYQYLANTGGGTCTNRTASDLIQCSLSDKTTSACKECEEGSVHAPINNITTCLKKTAEVISLGALDESKCDAWSEDFSKCYACKEAKDGDTCNNSFAGNSMQNVVQRDFSIITNKEIPAGATTGCKTGMFGPSLPDDSLAPDITCLECDPSSHMKILSDDDGGNINFYPPSYILGSNHPFANYISTQVPCHAKGSLTGFAKDDDGMGSAQDFSINPSNIIEMIKTPNGFVTSRCKAGFDQVWKEIKHNAAGDTALDGSSRGIYGLMTTDCTLRNQEISAPQKRYTGLEAGYNTFTGIHLNSLLHYDSCILSTDLFVFVGAQDSTTKHVYFSKLESGNSHEVCIKPNIADGTAHTIVDNCQIHFHEATDNDFTTVQTLKCLACKPGFAPTYVGDPDKTISACTAITNCDTSIESENTWLNSCQKCNDGHAWELVKATFYPNYGVCASTAKTNCLFKDSTGDKCIFCDVGYLLDDDDGCQKWEMNNCKTLGVPDVPTIMSANSDNHITTLGWTFMAPFIAYKYIGEENKNKFYAKSGCVECDTGYIRVSSDSDSDKYCTGTEAKLWYHAEVEDNCLKYSAETSKCVECVEGRVFDGSVCVNETVNTKNCLVENGGNCTSCRSGQPPQSNKCPLYENCEVVDPTTFKCARCKAYHKPKIGSLDYDCEPRDSNDVCKYYDHNKICLMCDDSTKSPITYVTWENKGYRTVCVDKYDDELTSNSKKDYAKFTSYTIRTSDPPPVQKVFSGFAKTLPSDSTYIMKSYSVMNPDISYNITSEYRDNFYGSVCIETPLTPNCDTYDNKLECTKCSPGFILEDETKLCLEGKVRNCEVYDNNPFCTKCQVDFYMSGTGLNATCEPRFKKNCKEFKDDADECTSCLENAFFTSGTGTCTNYTVTNCGEYNKTANECVSCELGVTYLDTSDGNKCKPNKTKFCKSWDSSFKDVCVDCFSNRYLGASQDCELYTVTNCKGDNDPVADKCTDCQAFYYLSADGKCEAATAKNCAKLKEDEDKCDGCKKGYFDDGSEVCQENTAENCAEKSQAENKCVTCLDVHYKDANNDCKPHTAKNCDTYESASNECSKCLKGFYLKAGEGAALKTCEPNGSFFCADKSLVANECLTCIDRYYLNDKKQCQAITNTTCATMITNKNECATCSKGKYIDQSDKKCKTLTQIDNCMTYSQVADMCETCKDGYYRSLDQKSCFVNPNGIDKCTRYTNLTTCEACDPAYYLNENKCVKYDEATEKIENCIEYTGVKICAKCLPKYIAVDNVCNVLTATGCATWADKDNCETCPSGLVFSDGTPKNCEANTIPNCVSASGTKGSETCERCDSSTFLKENKCEAVTVTVTDCQEYASDGICARCPINKAISADGKSCVDIDAATLGPNCTHGTYGSAPKCSICDSGYLMDSEGKCTISCQAANCFVCDPSDTAVCKLCKTGYHMDSELNCVLNNESGTSAGVDLLGSRAVLMGLLAFLVLHLSVLGSD